MTSIAGPNRLASSLEAAEFNRQRVFRESLVTLLWVIEETSSLYR